MSRARLLVCALAGIAAGVLCSCAESEPPRRSILLVSVDTLRADHMSSYGYPRTTTPHLDALAASGVLFEQVVTPRPKTTPSMVSLLTGLYPHDHGVRTNWTPLPGVPFLLHPERPLRPDPLGASTLAERLAVRGMRTAAFVSNFVLTRERSGLDRGFETYDDELTSHERNRPHVAERTARENTDRALAWLERNRDEPFFLWVHYIDPHGPYDAPERYRRGLEPAPVSRAAGRAERVPVEAPQSREAHAVDARGYRIFVAQQNLLPDPADPETALEAYLDAYDAEIRYTDAEIGRLLERLSELARSDDTMVLFTADHGESLGEHACYFEHGMYLYEPSARIPLIVRVPGAPPGARGQRVAAQVDLLDLLPTMLAWLELPDEPSLPGRSLLDALHGGAAPDDRVAFLERQEASFVMRAARTPSWKLIYNFYVPAHWPLPFARELYDLRTDPGELRNLYDSEEPPVVAARERLETALRAWIRSSGELRAQLGEDRESVAMLPEDARRQLEALGYLDPEPLESRARSLGSEAEFAARPAPQTQDPEALLEWELADGDPRVRALALEGLARYGAMPTAELARYLDPGQPVPLRVRAAELLGERGEPAALVPLEAALAATPASEAAFHLVGAYARARLDAKAPRDAIAHRLRDPSAALRGTAAWLAGRLGDPELRPALEPLRFDPVGEVRVLALIALTRLGYEDAADSLRAELLTVPASAGRVLTLSATARGLAEVANGTPIADTLRPLIESGEGRLELAGVEAVAWTDPAVATRLVDRFEQLGPQAKRRLVNAVGATAVGAVEPVLVRALSDPDAEVRVAAAVQLLRARSGRDPSR